MGRGLSTRCWKYERPTRLQLQHRPTRDRRTMDSPPCSQTRQSIRRQIRTIRPNSMRVSDWNRDCRVTLELGKRWIGDAADAGKHAKGEAVPAAGLNSRNVPSCSSGSASVIVKDDHSHRPRFVNRRSIAFGRRVPVGRHGWGEERSVTSLATRKHGEFDRR